MTVTPPISVADFKTRFDRNFNYGAGLDVVRDKDITDAIAEAQTMYNAALWSVADGKQAFLFATAHFVAVNIQAAGGLSATVTGEGVSNRGLGIVESKSVGQVSVSYTPPPDRLKKMAFLLPFWETEYGKKYIMMVLPKLSGNIGVVAGPADDTGASAALPFVGP
jgi:hypothetical protein